MRQVLFICLFGLLLSPAGSVAATHASPIDIRGGFIVLMAKVNGVEGTYILDTGAPGLVLNSKYRQGSKALASGLQGLNGDVHTTILPGWTFEWNSYKTSGSDGYAIDLTYLENAADSRIDGLVGLDVFDGYYVLLDYGQRTMELSTTIPEMMARQPSVTLPLEFQDHVPIVLLQHGQRSYRFVLDSGSGSHLIDHAVLTDWNTDVEVLDPIELVAADQKIVRTMNIEASGLKASGIALPPTQFVVTDLNAIREASGSQIDGILGLPSHGEQDRMHRQEP